MGTDAATPPANSRFFILALGLLVGFVIGFIVLLSNLPVDQSTVDFHARAVNGESGDPASTNFEFYTVLAGDGDTSLADRALRQPAGGNTAAASVNAVDPSASGAGESVRPGTLALASHRGSPGGTPPATAPGAAQTAAAPTPTAPAADTSAPRTPIIKPATRVVPGSAQSGSRQNLAAESYAMVPAENIGKESFYLQAGNFREAQAAERMRAEVLLLGLEAFIVTRQDASGALGHRVRIGPFRDQQRLTDAKLRLRRGEVAYEIIRVTG